MDSINSSYDNYRDATLSPPFFASPPPNGDSYQEKLDGPGVTGYPVQETPQQESRAFLPNESSRSSSISSSRNYVKRVPWLGLLALAASSATVLLSLTILLIVNHHVVWPNTGWSTFMRPASWLSALLSANGIFLHFALEEGLTVAWWYRASKPDATVLDLHDAWHHGTSLPAALFAGRRITYISMATIFCALLPLNGFLLQGAISTVLAEDRAQVNVIIPSVKSLPLGYSGTSVTAHSVDLLSTAFSDVWLQILNVEASPNAGYAFAGTFYQGDSIEPYDWGCEKTSICTGSVLGTGWKTTCDSSEIPYNLLPHSGNNGNSTYGTIFSTDISWYLSELNTIYMNLTWKDDSSCIGNLQHTFCTLEAATVEYPIQMQMNISSTNVYPGPYISLLDGTTRKDDKVIEVLPIKPGDGITNTTYGGISAYFRMYFESEMNITTHDGDGWGGYDASGHLAESLGPQIAENYDSNITDWNGYCNMTFEFPLQIMKNQQLRDGPVVYLDVEENVQNWTNQVDLADVILEPMRHAMFLASIYQGFSWYGGQTFDSHSPDVLNAAVKDNYVQNRTATQITPVSRYTVRFYLWGASLAVTYIIILFLIPLFWGFWTLRRKPSMSPVDLARAFKAPLLSEYEHETKTLLKQHGRRSIHYDLIPTSPELRRESSGTQGYFDMSSPRSQV